MLTEVRVGAAEDGEGTETARMVGASLKTRARLEMHSRKWVSEVGQAEEQRRGEPGLPASSRAAVCRLSPRGMAAY